MTVSIVVPIYNTDQYLSRCIDSLTGQSFSDLEIILVDDGSTDDSGRICDKYASVDSRVHVIHKENGGEASARNAGLRAANGEFVMFCDSDDEYLPDAVERLLEGINYVNKRYGGGGIDLSIGGYLERHNAKEYFAVSHTRIYTPKEATIFCTQSKDSYGLSYLISTVNGKIFRNKIIKENNISFDERFVVGNDTIFVTQYLAFVRYICSIFTPVYVYYKYDVETRVQGMSYKYADNGVVSAYATDLKSKLLNLSCDNPEDREIMISLYKNFIYHLPQFAVNSEKYHIDMKKYLCEFYSKLDIWDIGAKLILEKGFLKNFTSIRGLYAWAVSLLIRRRAYDKLISFLKLVAKLRRTAPFEGDYVRCVFLWDKQEENV